MKGTTEQAIHSRKSIFKTWLKVLLHANHLKPKHTTHPATAAHELSCEPGSHQHSGSALRTLKNWTHHWETFWFAVWPLIETFQQFLAAIWENFKYPVQYSWCLYKYVPYQSLCVCVNRTQDDLQPLLNSLATRHLHVNSYPMTISSLSKF